MTTGSIKLDIKRFYDKKIMGPRYCGYSNRYCYVPDVCSSCLEKAEMGINYLKEED